MILVIEARLVDEKQYERQQRASKAATKYIKDKRDRKICISCNEPRMVGEMLYCERHNRLIR